MITLVSSQKSLKPNIYPQCQKYSLLKITYENYNFMEILLWELKGKANTNSAKKIEYQRPKFPLPVTNSELRELLLSDWNAAFHGGPWIVLMKRIRKTVTVSYLIFNCWIICLCLFVLSLDSKVNAREKIKHFLLFEALFGVAF